jgi:hypothetical protein
VKKTIIICDRCRESREYDGVLGTDDARAEWAWFWPETVVLVGHQTHYSEEPGHICHSCLTDLELHALHIQDRQTHDVPF